MGNTPTKYPHDILPVLSAHPEQGLTHAEADLRREAGLCAGVPKA